MTPRERVLTALQHLETDKFPVDFGGHRSSGIAAIAYARLRKYLGLPERPIRVYDMIQQLAIIDDDVLALSGSDTIEMGRGFCLKDEDWKPWILPDGTECEIPVFIHVEKQGDDWVLVSEKGQVLGIQKKGCLYFEQTHFPLMDRGLEDNDFHDLEEMLGDQMWNIPSPGAHIPLNETGLRELREGAKALRERTDKAIIGLFGGNMFEIPSYLYRMDNYLLALALNPDKILELEEKLCALHLKNLEKWMSAVAPYIDIVLFGDDLGGQQGPLISPEMYRTFIKPFHSKLWKRAKELAPVKVLLHCCGGIRELLPNIIDAGADAINPVQISCAGMDPSSLKTTFGHQITFWGGGCDTQHVLLTATPSEVKKHVKEMVKIFKPGGGYVFQQVHNILANVPPENIVSMFEAINS